MVENTHRELSRYQRQEQFAPLGVEGQRHLQAATVLICGCGALGSVIANTLARAGVGRLRIVDRDLVELHNLQRQVLYDESDVAANLPKAIAAARHLSRINSTIEIEPRVADVTARSIEPLLQGVDAIADGTDNFETRFLLNDAAHHFNIPWVYGGCIGAEGQTMTILPHETACLRCLLPELPPPGTMATCDTAGILGPIVNIVASLQAAEILKLVSGRRDAIHRQLTVIDIWQNRFRALGLDSLRTPHCPTCGLRRYDWLDGTQGSQTAVLCGRHAVQITFPEHYRVNLDELEQRLALVGEVQKTPFLLRARISPYDVTVFPDGRAVIAGTADPAEARSVYARYLGN